MADMGGTDVGTLSVNRLWEIGLRIQASLPDALDTLVLSYGHSRQ